MKLRDIVQTLNLIVYNPGAHLDDDVTGGYAGDLLSDVIASGRKGDIWVTIQVHENIIAVAVLKDLTAIILSKNSKPMDETIAHAAEEEVTILGSNLTTYQLVEKLAGMGVSGSR